MNVQQTTGHWELPETARCSYGRSSQCTGVGTRMIDPYDSDVNNRKIVRYLCDPCEQTLADAI